MGLLDFITGGENKKAEADLANIMAQIQGIKTPTAADLQLSPLAEYSSTGQLDPALMTAAQTGPSAFENENLSAVPMSTMQQVLAKEGEIANSNGMTPQERAAIAEAESEVNRNTQGQRGAIAQDFAGRGVPQSLISAALQSGAVGQDSQNEYLAALQAEGAASDRGLTALGNEGAFAGNMSAINSNQANAVAAAQDALNKFNAANTQQGALANQATKQAANTYNTTNAQNIANENISGKQKVQIQNQVEAPQEAAGLALQKGAELAGAGEAQAGQHTAAGQQAAGLFGGVLGAGAMLGAGALMAPAAGAAGPIATGAGNTAAFGPSANFFADGGEIPPKPVVAATPFVKGGQVPGQAPVGGNSPQNDTVPARLSPGEFVVPRTAMARPEVRNFLAQNVPTPRPPAGAHPSDIASIMKALSMLRTGA